MFLLLLTDAAVLVVDVGVVVIAASSADLMFSGVLFLVLAVVCSGAYEFCCCLLSVGATTCAKFTALTLKSHSY